MLVKVASHQECLQRVNPFVNKKYRYVILQKKQLENMKIHCECGICGHTVDQECIMNDCDCCVNFHVRSG